MGYDRHKQRKEGPCKKGLSVGRGIKLYRITGAGQGNRVFIDSKQYKKI